MNAGVSVLSPMTFAAWLPGQSASLSAAATRGHLASSRKRRWVMS